MLKKIQKVRTSLRLLALSAAAILLTATFAAPAHAADVERILESKSLPGVGLYNDYSSSNSQAWMADRTYWDVAIIEDKGTWLSKPQVKIQIQGRCLDTLGHTSGGDTWWYACNTGDYQLWQVFQTGSGSSAVYTYKSKAAYTKQGGLHLCLRVLNKSAALYLYTCNAASTQQQFKLLT